MSVRVAPVRGALCHGDHGNRIAIIKLLHNNNKLETSCIVFFTLIQKGSHHLITFVFHFVYVCTSFCRHLSLNNKLSDILVLQFLHVGNKAAQRLDLALTVASPINVIYVNNENMHSVRQVFIMTYNISFLFKFERHLYFQPPHSLSGVLRTQKVRTPWWEHRAIKGCLFLSVEKAYA